MQGRRDSNPRLPVLETGALPTELRPWVRANDCSRAVSDILYGMSEQDSQQGETENLEPQEQRTNDADDVLRDVLQRDQEHKGYGDDEGERDESFPKT
jgi:hypothetical protein